MDSARPPPACAECLFNPDLLAEILAHLAPTSDRGLRYTLRKTGASLHRTFHALHAGVLRVRNAHLAAPHRQPDSPATSSANIHIRAHGLCTLPHFNPCSELTAIRTWGPSNQNTGRTSTAARRASVKYTTTPRRRSPEPSARSSRATAPRYSRTFGQATTVTSARETYFAALAALGVSLRRLTLHGAPSAGFFRALVQLEDLEVRSFGEAVSEDSAQLLPALRRLRIPGCRAAHMLAFLRRVASDNLQSIAILDERWDSVETVDAPSQRAVCELIATPWAPTLRSLELHTRSIDGVDSLQRCTQLTALALHCATFPAVRLLALTRAWPALTAPAAHGVDLAALAQLAAQLPRLVRLEADLALTNILSPLPTTPALAHGLQHLVLHSFPPAADDAPLLARHLARLFPRLGSIRYAGRAYAPRDPWAGVLDCVFGDADGAGKYAYESALSPTVVLVRDRRLPCSCLKISRKA
ncbi:hypothetical protein B0H10DRAFT_2196852 [Mycena sp. CBHHK59/15]|nr:hypothetical protein B0H10DRAFT_2196852 [Mycena sp. CBHHK59/15]